MIKKFFVALIAMLILNVSICAAAELIIFHTNDTHARIQSSGMLEVNEEMLANAIVNNPDKVSSVLGADGLAGKTQQHVSFANFQQDRLFPTAQSMLGDQINTASIYTGNAYIAMSSYASVGNLVNMLF